MEFYEALRARCTVREFLTKPVPEEVVQRVLAAGLLAPCNAHLKYWEFILLRDPAKRRETVVNSLGVRDIKDPQAIEALLASCGDDALKEVYRRALPLQLTMMLTAPEVLLVCYKMKPLNQSQTLFELNPLASVWMCIENIMLALAAEGLYGCTYTPYQDAGLKEYLGIPTGYRVAAVIPLGYAAHTPAPRIPEDPAARLHMNKW
jgi:nitroreductase